MTLSTHAVVGATSAALFPSHPITAFIAGFLSHFILDAIPHWDYKILSAYANPDMALSKKSAMADKYFMLDLLRTGSDAFIGLSVVFLIWYPAFSAEWRILLLGAIGGMFPDFLQFVYARFPHQPMTAIQRFHNFIHADYRLDDKPVLGIFLQIVTMICVVILVKYLIKF